ncbi:uncharacterized protein LODBEIA_P12680 [Lodderomyces beijingensis]|uniref:ABC transporter domain-containing protein n=1 Tax=Lodderomyces beijingensis TaxID=1775926 RepID=A0ABP0ZFT4_9ASCO
MSQRLKRCLLSIKNANFKTSPSKQVPFVFQTAVDNFQITTQAGTDAERNSFSSWIITGPLKSTMLKVIAGKYISVPPLARSYPGINDPATQLQFLDFKEQSGLESVHMSARYESYSFKGALEMSDDVNSVFNYITGLNNYNSQHKTLDRAYIEQLLNLLNVTHLQHKWINSLSNGQIRRARIAKSLVHKPSLLVIDDPFLGLDPSNTVKVNDALAKIHENLDTSIVLGLRTQDERPNWVQGLGYADESGLSCSGNNTIETNAGQSMQWQEPKSFPTTKQAEPNLVLSSASEFDNVDEPHIEFNNARVAYKGLTIIDNFNWLIPRASKWRIMGDNGTGKTTILSLITADHPQSWRSVLKINGLLRQTGKGITFFDVNNQIGISSPELHALVPQHKMTMMDVIQNGLIGDIGNSNFLYNFNPEKVGHEAMQRFDSVTNHFRDRIGANGDVKFADLTMTDQKLALFLRAIVKNPDILILDEAFSCMEDEDTMVKCHELLNSDPILKKTTVLAIGHLGWELPKYDYMIKLLGDEDRNYEIYKVAAK